MAIAPQVQQFNVGGVLLERPFKVRRLGHFGFNLVNVEEGASPSINVITNWRKLLPAAK